MPRHHFSGLKACVLSVLLASSMTSVWAAPASTINMAPASQIDFSAYKGKVVMIDFWASWCGPCQLSFPWMQQMQAKYGKDGLVIVAINVDREPQKALEFLKKYQPNFEIREDRDGKLASQLQVQGMPSTFILDRNGKPAAKHQGFFQAKQAAYEAEIVRLLGSTH